MTNDQTPATIYLWRAFRLHASREHILHGMRAYWPTAEGNARCSKDDHSVPHENCSCGIYGYYDPADAWAEAANSNKLLAAIHGSHMLSDDTTRLTPFIILARCRIWGKTIEADRGVRTANAEIIKAYMIGRVYAQHMHPLMERYPTVEWELVHEVDLLTILSR